MSPDEQREILGSLAGRKDDASSLDRRAPGCACEQASRVDGGFGPVADDEVLLFIIASPSQVGSRKSGGYDEPKAKIFQRAETCGISTIRQGRATKEEILITARILWENAINQQPDTGGIYGLLQFTCSNVRGVSVEAEIRDYCVYDTPVLHEGRPSHSDIFQACGNLNAEDKRERRNLLFNTLISDDWLIPVHDFMDGILSHLAPKALQQNDSA